ncbi:hypothetical protein M422DRAFT_49925 [Sphaerobolus stellatus SS14]|uniref:Uncharacterized protein n=1 Tax=Sphaerobolus stellatus (strain SS14) TaxID=990650 RepID=A0A0C9VM62_SPHS4|nr:hypothetical protein M422DRAFT_49925 [Sphaerobolus stellatus SS14]
MTIRCRSHQLVMEHHIVLELAPVPDDEVNELNHSSGAAGPMSFQGQGIVHPPYFRQREALTRQNHEEPWRSPPTLAETGADKCPYGCGIFVHNSNMDTHMEERHLNIRNQNRAAFQLQTARNQWDFASKHCDNDGYGVGGLSLLPYRLVSEHV